MSKPTMRERLIEAASDAVEYGGTGDTFSPVSNWAAVIDAILAELREPDEGMRRSGGDEVGRLPADTVMHEAAKTAVVAFTAMIDHVRLGPAGGKTEKA